MIILKFVPYDEKFCKKKHFLGKRIVQTVPPIKRTNLYLNGGTVFRLELPKEALKREDVKTLIRRYKGNIIVLPEEAVCELQREYLFDPTRYYTRALLAALSQYIADFDGKWQNICIKITDFEYFEEFSTLAKTARRLTVITENNLFCERFKRDCYYTYGAAVVFTPDIPLCDFDVYADFSKIDPRGTLPLVLKNGSCMLYPKKDYFVPSEAAIEVMRLGVDSKLACAAFNLSNKSSQNVNKKEFTF